MSGEDGFKNVAIIGLGLLGASLAMSLKNKKIRRLGWTRRAEVRQKLFSDGVIDETADDPETLLSKAELTVICLPVQEIIRFCSEHVHAWKKGAVVSDVGSVKGIIDSALTGLFAPRGVDFIGAHPMAGTEKSGPEAAFPELYENAPVFICPDKSSSPDNLLKLRRFWEQLNTVVMELPASDHDMLVARTSHVPHVVSLALTLSVLDCPTEEETNRRYYGCAGGFRDTSRITSSSPQMWRQIIEQNKGAVLEALKSFQHYLDRTKNMIENDEYDKIENEFATGRRERDLWLAKRYPKKG